MTSEECIDKITNKDDIYHDVIVEVWNDGRQTGSDTYFKWDD